MTIRLKNTATKTVEEYRDNPAHPGVVHMYHCGPTVYQRAHVGNHRAFIFADIIRRAFELADYKVNQVINITDVGHLTDDGDAGDDKLEREAGKIGKRATDIAREITEFFCTILQHCISKQMELNFLARPITLASSSN